jgi:hypothetical protein
MTIKCFMAAFPAIKKIGIAGDSAGYPPSITTRRFAAEAKDKASPPDRLVREARADRALGW